MSIDQIISLVSSFGGTIVILARMRSYVTVEEYRTGKAALHVELNQANLQIVRLEETNKRLEVEITHLKERK